MTGPLGPRATLTTSTRRALQPLWNALDAVAALPAPRPPLDTRDELAGAVGRTVSVTVSGTVDGTVDVPASCATWAAGPPLRAGAVVAVSGGPDSRALLEAVARWPRRPEAPFVVVAVDHQRRDGSRAEADAVVARAAAVGLAGVVVAVEVGAPRSSSAEQELRRARYAALRDAARDHGVVDVVTAHHRGDVAEGVLLHLAGRGGGRGGRAPAVVEVRGGGRIVRPFLALPKTTLRAALDALDIHDVVVDADDEAGRNARGLIRKQLLAPLLELRDDVEVALARHARHRADDDAVLDALVPDADAVDVALAPALLRRWLLRQIARHGDDPRTGGAAIDDVLAFCARAAAGDRATWHAAHHAGEGAGIDLRGCRAEIRRARGRGAVVVVVARGRSRP